MEDVPDGSVDGVTKRGELGRVWHMMELRVWFAPGSEEEGGPITHAKQQQPATTQQERGFLQKLKDVFWKPEETEPQVEEIKKDSQKMN